MKKRKKILFITEDFPSGLNGASVRTRSTLESILALGHSVEVCCFHFKDFNVHDFSHKNLKIHTVTTKRRKRTSVLFLKHLFSIVFSWAPISIRRLFNVELQQKVKKILDTNIDIIVYDGYSTLQYLEKNFAGKSIFIDTEDFTDLYRQRFIAESRFFEKIFYFLEYIKSLFYERKTMRHVSQIWAISPKTKKRLEKMSGVKTILMPTYIEREENIYTGKKSNIVFTGTLNWRENIEGLKWFVENHWDRIISKIPDATLVVIGQGASENLQHFLLTKKNILYKGYVKSLKKEYSQAALAIAPVRINAGIKVKILTYLSFGLPVISTKKAAWGLVSTDGVLVVNDNKFADGVIRLLQQPTRRASLSIKGYSNIVSNYSLEGLKKFVTAQFKI